MYACAFRTGLRSEELEWKGVEVVLRVCSAAGHHLFAILSPKR